MHASPAEHQAQAISDFDFVQIKASNLGVGWLQFRKTLANEFVTDLNTQLKD